MLTAVLTLPVLLVASAADPVDFDTRIMPILTKSGCNAGACHGSARGRGGFKLSLYGSDPQADHEAIAWQLEGRRVNLASPDRSLLLLKPTEQMEHGGGFQLDPEGEGARILLHWLEKGAQRAGDRQLVSFQVQPTTHRGAEIGARIDLAATAGFSDGTTVDVTRWTVFTPEDPAAIQIDDTEATARVLRRGRHIVIARYLDRVLPIELMVPLTDVPVDTSELPRHNFIDDFVYERVETLQLPVSPPAEDAVLLRRVRLDLTGTLPTPETVRQLSESSDVRKYEAFLDRQLNSEEFVTYWTYRLAELLRIRSHPQDRVGARTYFDWLRHSVANWTGYDEFARILITASGDSHTVGPANFYRTSPDARTQAEFISELFLGVRLRCANCHNHPLDHWTQDDYHGLAAVFARLDLGRVISVGARGEVTHPRTGEPAIPKLPGSRFLARDGDRRETLADWLTHGDNPYFATAIVNRLWKAMMGRGLVEPTDDLRKTNPPTHPQLLRRLAQDFVAHGYDIRHTLRRIGTSAAYRRGGAVPTEHRLDDRFYAHALERPLPPEVLADAMTDVTGVPSVYGDEPPGTRAVALFDSRIESRSLDLLGRCSREGSCESVAPAGGLARKLHLINGPLINGKIVDPKSRLQKRLSEGRSAEQIVEEFYMRALCRMPSPNEASYWIREFGEAQGRGLREPAEDFLWSLLSCREFVTNH